MDRSSARASAMKLIYEWEMGGEGGQETRQDILGIQPEEEEADYMESLVAGVREHIDEIDGRIAQYARGWSLNRISRVDLSIMRVAVYEITAGTVSEAVAINEALELARKYSTEQSVSFINGVLGNLSRAQK